MTTGMGQPVYNTGLLVTTTSGADAPAVRSGIKISDVITKINGEEIRGGEKTVADFIGKVRSSPEKPIVLEVVRGAGEESLTKFGSTSWGILDTVDDKKGRTETITVVPARREGNNYGSIGIGINPRLKEVKTIRTGNLADAMVAGADQTGRLTSVTWNAFTSAVLNGYVLHMCVCLLCACTVYFAHAK